MFKSFLFIFFSLVIQNVDAQRIHEESEHYHSSTNFMETKSDSSKMNVRPIRFVMGALMYGYQNVISDHYFSHCLYTPSCSNFSKYAIKEFGWFKGIFITADRIQRCNSLSQSEESPEYRLETYKFFDPPNRYKKHD